MNPGIEFPGLVLSANLLETASIILSIAEIIQGDDVLTQNTKAYTDIHLGW
jgi:hypothetical protein